MAGPLDGVKVLDLTTMLSGPCAAQTLAEMGARWRLQVFDQRMLGSDLRLRLRPAAD